MNPVTVYSVVRLIAFLSLYAFLGTLLWLMWRDVQAATRTTTSRTRRLGQLVLMDADPALGPLSPGHHFPLVAVTSIGRAPTNTVCLPDDAISLEHALLHFRDGQWWLEDLASRNGTRLNDAPIAHSVPVMPGDVVGIGRARLKLEVE